MFRLALLGLLKIYKFALSPAFFVLGARCRHEPSCSEYSYDSISRHGTGKGVMLTLARLSRCHPWGSHGYDPAPDTLADEGWKLWRYGDWSWTERPARQTPQTEEADNEHRDRHLH